MAHSTRRALLGTALAAAGTVAVAAPALTAEPGADAEILRLADEHEQLAREYMRYVDISCEMDACSPEYKAEARIGNALHAQSRQIEERASECTATTIAGIRAQLAIVMRTLTADSEGDEPVDLPENAESAWNILSAMVEGLDQGVSL